MPVERTPEIAAYIEERRAVLLNEDIEVMRAHLIKWGKESARTADAEVLRIAWHKGRTGVTDIPVEERQKSVDWLAARGFEHWADDLRPSKEMS